MNREWMLPCPTERPDEGSSESPGGAAHLTPATPTEPNRRAIYITGHSLGGALAALAAAVIYSDNRFKHLRTQVKGIYTFGPPMFCDATFARAFEENLGKNLFYHIYRRDIVPQLPPYVMGPFVHVGRQYVASNKGWVHEERPVRKALSLSFSNLLGITSFITQQLFSINWLSLPFSWADHSPHNYIRTSMTVPPGIEFQ